ncbi:MAG TPA: UvrD-helicase domain-containing protein [Pirellulales bacterium]|jgi:ATP-dependent helicase/nuclease subunit A
MATATSSGVTEEQHDAINKRGVSIALSAGAGCGKTHVLVERFLAALSPETNSEGGSSSSLSRLIAITFTDRAAREMRDRLRRKCRDRLHKASDQEAPAWLALLRELETARVSTIHAFCGALLRAHAVEADIDPHFQILQPGQSATLFSEQIDDQLRAQLGNMNEDLLDLVVMFNLPRLREMFQHLLGHRHEIDFAAWAKMTPQELVKKWQKVERDELLPQLRDKFLELPEVATVRKIVGNWTPENQKLIERFEALKMQLAALDGGADILPAWAIIRESATVQYVTHERHWRSLGAERYAEYRDAVKAVRKWIDDTLPKCGIEPNVALASASAGLALLRVAEPILQAYEKQKRELGLLDFDDLLALTRKLLNSTHGEKLRNRLSSQLDLLLVDEFQDTDPLQVELVKALCGDQLERGKLFFVGDAKQSIYRFRGADPAVFRELQKKIPSEGRLPLTKNFRSQPAVLDFVNALFCERLDKGQYRPLTASRPALAQAPAIEFLWATLPGDNVERVTVEPLRRCEADWLARRLAALLDSHEILVPDRATGESRPAGPGDVAILFRALSDVRYYEEALRRYGIPHYLVGGGAFYAQQEIFDLLNLLRAIDAPGDDVSLVGVLRSPFFSLADETLFWLGQHPEGITAGLFATELPKDLDREQRRQAKFAAETLLYLRARKDRLPVAALIREALARTGYDALLLAEFLGERKLANLRKMIDQARGFDESGIFTLSDFIHELGEFIARQPDEPPAPVELENSTVVRLMTIHQAKGLEFPVVIVPDLARAKRNSQDAFEFDKELGPLVRAKTSPASEGACGLDLFRKMEEPEEADEGIRLLYVATTRAADYLMLSAGVKNLDEPPGWLEFVGERFDLRSGDLRVALPPEYGRPRVNVTLEEPPAPRKTTDGAGHVDWKSITTQAHERAANGRGILPPLVAPLSADRTAQRVFSFSRLASDLKVETSWPDVVTDEGRAAVELLTDDVAGDATKLGSLVHAVLAQVAFSNERKVAERCRDELARRFATADVNLESAAAMIEQFLRSPRAEALRQAQAVHRELEFLLRWPPGGAGEGQSIQGVIDCLYQDRDGGWHILDYKTNRVSAAGVPRLAASYELQMALYALAVDEVLGVSPTSLTLYFLQPKVEHAVPWNMESRARVIERVNAALGSWQAATAN